jgi:chromosome segregation ATPase
LKISSLEEENARLKKTVEVKDRVIEDITEKIQLLEEAIDEHERTLTSRDHMME